MIRYTRDILLPPLMNKVKMPDLIIRCPHCNLETEGQPCDCEKDKPDCKKNETEKFFAVQTQIPIKDVASLLCSAFEGGSSYWASLVDVKEPKEWIYQEFDSPYAHEYPVNPGGRVIIRDMEHDGDEDEKVYTLDNKAIQRGLDVMARDYPRHWSDFRKEDYDACTGDVLLQCCLFGDIIYG